MALNYGDRTKENSTTTGTGTYTLSGAVTGFQTFAAGVGTANTTNYCATDGVNWEVGLGTYTTGASNTLTRTSIIASSNSGSAVNWGAGTRTVSCVMPAQTLTGIFSAGVSSTLTTDATSASTGSITTAGGISTQKSLWVGTTSRHVGATQFDAAITYGGVTLSNAVTGTGNMVLSASPTFTGTLTAAAITASGAVTGTRFTPTATGNTGLGLAGAGSPGIYVNGTTEAARFDTSGRFILASTSVVNGNSKQSIWVTAGNNALETNVTTTAAYNPAQFYNNSSSAGVISVSGTTTTYGTSSDARMKANVADAASASELIDAIKVRQFDWLLDNKHQRYGMIAQELVAVAPEAVHVPADSEEMMAIDYSKLVPMLVKEIQSLRTRLAALENK